MRKLMLLAIVAVLLTSCEDPVIVNDPGVGLMLLIIVILLFSINKKLKRLVYPERFEQEPKKGGFKNDVETVNQWMKDNPGKTYDDFLKANGVKK